MAQVVKLKRTSVAGKVPTTSTLELGELAINTYDGKIYFEKDSGTPSIEEIVTTNSTTTGSIQLIGSVTASYFIGNIQATNGIISGSSQVVSSLNNQNLNLGTGAITASYFVGNGSGITNLPAADVSQVATVTSSFDNQSSITVTHNFDSKNVIVSVYGSNDSQIIPSSVTLTNNNTTTIELSSPQSGYAVVAKGGHIVTGSLLQEITQVATVTASFDAQSTINVTHNFNTKNVIISVYDSNDYQLIPSSVHLSDLDTATIELSSAQSGYVVVGKSGHLVNGTGTTSYTNLTNIPLGIISGSGATTGSNTFTGLQTFQQIQEVVSLKSSFGGGTTNFDFNSGSIFYIGGLTGSGTWNVQNIPSSSNSATSLTFVVEQGVSAYTASAYQLGGTAVTVKWLDGTSPTGSVSSTDVIGLTAFRSGSSWNVVGSLSKFS